MGQAEHALARLIVLAAAVGGLWLCGRFLLPWAAPFLLAFAVAALMEPLVRRLTRQGWRRGAAAGFTSLGVLGLAGWGVSALAGWGISALSDFAGEVPALMRGLAQGLDGMEGRVLAMIDSAPAELADTLRLALDSVGQTLYALPGQLSQWALDRVRRLAGRSPDLLLFAATAGIGSYFCSASFPRVLAFLSAQVPERLRERLKGMGADLKGSFGGWMRAQGILMAITFFELLLAFWLLGVRGAVGVAAVTAFVDALPVFGTGVVLAPWALYSLLLGEYTRGIGLLAIWGGVTLVRSCIEAKLLGDQIGLDPLASLAAMYVGWRVWSVWGMLLFPVLLVTLRQLNDKGVVRLWKRI